MCILNFMFSTLPLYFRDKRIQCWEKKKSFFSHFFLLTIYKHYIHKSCVETNNICASWIFEMRVLWNKVNKLQIQNGLFFLFLTIINFIHFSTQKMKMCKCFYLHRCCNQVKEGIHCQKCTFRALLVEFKTKLIW